MTPETTALPVAYDDSLITLSIVIAIFTSYTALDLAGRVAAARGRMQRTWILGGAITMGAGIWSMHFIGMQALSLPVQVTYDPPTVFASMIVAMVASGAAFFMASRQMMEIRQWVFGGIFMGFGMAAMHYIGMEAMQMPAVMQYNMALLSLSGAIALVGAFTALRLAFTVRDETIVTWRWDKVWGALVMGSAIAGMHYTAMAAVTFIPSSGSELPIGRAIGTSWLGPLALAVATFLVLVLALLTSFIDRRFAEALGKSERRLASLYETGHAVVSNLELEPLLQTITDTAKSLLNARMGGLVVFGERMDTHEYFTVSGGDYKLDPLFEKTRLLHHTAESPLCFRIENSLVHLTNPVSSPQGYPPLKGFLGVPLQVKGRTLGTILVGNGAQEKDFTKDDEDLLSAFANDAAIALENARLYERQKQDVIRLQELSHQLDKAQESRLLTEERTRIAHELHDQVAQVLFAVGIKANWCLERLTPQSDIAQAIRTIKRLASESSLHIRNAIYGLSSPNHEENQSLKTFLREMVWEFKESTGIDSDLMVLSELQPFSHRVEETLCKVTKEALANVAKHSQARVAVVSLRSSPQEVTLTVQDDGIGLPCPIKETYWGSINHFGLKGMRRRAEELGGHFHLANGEEGGLILTMTLPMNNVKNEQDSLTDR